MTTPEFEQLSQISKGPVWDGDLISKHDRDKLFKSYLLVRAEGFNSLSEQGLRVAKWVGLLKEGSPVFVPVPNGGMIDL